MAYRPSQANRQPGDAVGMAGGSGIARLDRGYRCAHEAGQQMLDIVEQHLVFDRHCSLTGERQQQTLVLLREWLDCALDRLQVPQRTSEAPPPVDPLQDPDHLCPSVAPAHPGPRTALVT